MPNSVDPDETAHYEPSHLDLRCLQKPIIIAYGSEKVTWSIRFTALKKNIRMSSAVDLIGALGVKISSSKAI